MKSKIITSIFLILVCLPFFVWQAVKNHVDRENYEKRTLKAFPALSLAQLKEFPKNFDEYLNDHLPFRNQLVRLNSLIHYYGFRSSTESGVIVGKDGWLFYGKQGDGDPIAAYKGINVLSEEELLQIKNNLLQAKEYFSQRNIEFIVFIAPNKERVYEKYMPSFYGQASKTYAVQQLVDYIKEKTDIQIIYPVEEINAMRDHFAEKFLYHKTDTHWNTLGSYIGMQDIFKTLRINKPNILDKNIEIREYDDSPGDLSYMINIGNNLNPGKSYEVIERLPEKKEGETAKDGRKVLIRMDSFGVAMAPHFLNAFVNPIMVTTFNYNREMIQQEKPDVYIIEYVERIAPSYMLLDYMIY